MWEQMATGLLSGAVRVSGFFTSSIVNSKLGNKFFNLLPWEIVLASLDGFNKVFDAVEVAGRNVMSTTSVVITGLVTDRHGNEAAKVTNEGLDAAGHTIGTAWAVFKGVEICLERPWRRETMHNPFICNFCTKDLEKHNDYGNLGQSCTNLSVSHKSNGEGHINQDSTLPPLCDLDMGVIESLPRNLLLEINDLYGGILISLMSKHKGKSADIGSLWPTSSGSGGGVTYEEKVEETSNRDFNAENSLLKSSVHEKKNQSTVERVQSASVSGAGTLNMTSSFPEDNNVMPFSLSQVDLSVLQQLPEEMKVDILELLPPHRRQECTSDLGPHKPYPRDSFHAECIGNQRGSRDSVSDNELLIGNPPRWVDNFKLRNCVISNIFADMYYNSGSTGQLSSILQLTMSDFRFPLGSNTDGLDDAIRCLSELLKQYIKLKIETDIEEIYLCFCLLRRLSTKSTFFLEVYKVILPDIQATVGENYGGNFRT